MKANFYPSTINLIGTTTRNEGEKWKRLQHS